MRSLRHSLLFSTVLASGIVGACTHDDVVSAVAKPETYPRGPYSIEVGGTLPDFSFEGAGEDGALGPIHLQDYLETGKGPRQLLSIEVSGGLWCGTCRWYAEHAIDALPERAASRIRRLEIILGDRDDAPARPEDALVFRETFGLRKTAVAADPTFRLGALLHGRKAPLPLLVLVDPRTMRVLDVLENPSPGEWVFRVESALAVLDEAPPPPPLPSEEPLIDGLFFQNEWDLLATTTVPDAPPSDPTNAVADLAMARDLGKALYFDAGLSPSGTVSCATCHAPDKALSDGTPVAKGVAIGNRRTPSIALSAHARWQFWDGRADSLWAQALGPLENGAELDSSRVFVARRVLELHGAQYEQLFGGPLPEVSQWPLRGKPGDAAYDSMSELDRAAVTRVFVGAAKAMAAYERSFRVAPNRFDRYLAGDHDALDPSEKLGLQVFVRSGCLQCHWGPRLTDDAFHDTRTATGRADGAADMGRAEGWRAFSTSEFGASSVWSDARAPIGRTPSESDLEATLGRFKTPALRGVADLDYFGHGGAVGALAGVTEAYGRGGIADGDPSSAGAREPWLMPFGETAQWALVPFLETLTAKPILE